MTLQEKIKHIKESYKTVWEDSLPNTKRELDIVFKWVPRFENNILALVYLGAAFLVIVLGLRGLGSDIPEILKDKDTGRLYSTIIYIALLGEFIMICLLALIMHFKIEDFNGLFREYWKEIDNNDNHVVPLSPLSARESSGGRRHTNLDELERQIKEDVEKILSIKKTLNEFSEKLRHI